MGTNPDGWVYFGDLDPLQLGPTGEEPIGYTNEYFGNFTLCEITKIPLLTTN